MRSPATLIADVAAALPTPIAAHHGWWGAEDVRKVIEARDAEWRLIHASLLKELEDARPTAPARQPQPKTHTREVA